jgi:DNA-binding beta-propeller fold protein YncE
VRVGAWAHPGLSRGALAGRPAAVRRGRRRDPSRRGAEEETALLIFDRDPATGALTRRANIGCATPSGSSGACLAAPQLSSPQDIVVSPDGKNVYVSNAGTSSIVEFSRSAAGGLTLMGQCQGTTTPCVVDTGMGAPHALALSPDGNTLYARTILGAGMGTLLAFHRNADGTLTQLSAPDGCWSEVAQSGCQTAAGISDESTQIAVTSSALYATGRNDAYTWYTYGCFGSTCGYFFPNLQPSTGTIAIFGRSADGTLTQAAEPNGCISSTGQSGGIPSYPGGPAPVRCLDGNDALNEAYSVTASPDGKSIYVGTAEGLVSYNREGATLVETGCLRTGGAGGCANATALGGIYRMAVTPSGDELIAASYLLPSDGALDFLQRDTGSGQLSQRPGTRGCISNTGTEGKCQTLPALGGMGGVTVSPDSEFVYATGVKNGLLATLHRDVAPSCDSRTVAVPYQTSVAVPLTCTDANGDALTLAITRQPTAGTLAGAIDTANNTIRYNPPLGFVGADSFQYAATGQGVQSPPATVTLDVRPLAAASVIPPAPAQRLSHLRPRIKSGWGVHGTRFVLKSLRLSKLPAGWKATLRCAGPHCPLKAKKIRNAKAKSSSVDVLRSLSKRQRRFRAGQKLTLQITAPGYAPARVLFALKKGKKPKPVTKG